MRRGVLCVLIRVSAGTAAVLGLRDIKSDVLPTTAYVMAGEKCGNNCAFCVRARTSTAREGLLSRVHWYETEDEKGLAALLKNKYRSGGIRRICIQVVNGMAGPSLSRMISDLGGNGHIKLSVSGGVETVDDAKRYIDAGADTIGVALDAACEGVYSKIKGGSFHKRLELIKDCVREFPGRITTHLIAGLGETEQEMIDMISNMYNWGVRVGLFAFTPLKGTAMESVNPPDICSYRRIQAASHLLKNRCVNHKEFRFKNGRLDEISREPEELRRILEDGEAFRTSGCADCNRPYYNERPGRAIYNYPRQLTKHETDECLEQTGLFR